MCAHGWMDGWIDGYPVTPLQQVLFQKCYTTVASHHRYSITIIYIYIYIRASYSLLIHTTVTRSLQQF